MHTLGDCIFDCPFIPELAEGVLVRWHIQNYECGIVKEGKDSFERMALLLPSSYI